MCMISLLNLFTDTFINIIANILVTTSRKLIAFSTSTYMYMGERVYSVQSTIDQSDFIQSYS